MSIYEGQVQVNLDNFQHDRHATPEFIAISKGLVQVSDAANVKAAISYEEAASWIYRPEASATRTTTENWTVHPVIDPMHLERLRVLFLVASGYEGADIDRLALRLWPNVDLRALLGSPLPVTRAENPGGFRTLVYLSIATNEDTAEVLDALYTPGADLPESGQFPERLLEQPMLLFGSEKAVE